MNAPDSRPDRPEPPSRGVSLPVDGPFNLEATVRLLQRRPANRIDHWEDGRYLRAFQTTEGPRLVAVSNSGTIVSPNVHLEISGGAVSVATTSELQGVTRWMLGLDAEPAPTAWLAEQEPRLGTIAAAVSGFRPPCFPTIFETCARIIPYQQLSIDAGTAIAGRLIERLGGALALDEQTWFTFPGPEAIAEADPDALREVGLSRAKVTALQALARLAQLGELDHARFRSLDSDDALAALQALPGIGVWSAGLILLRGLRRMDVFPSGDVGAARNLTTLIERPMPISPAEASAYAARLGDRKGYLYFLGLAGQLLARGISLGGGTRAADGKSSDRGNSQGGA